MSVYRPLTYNDLLKRRPSNGPTLTGICGSDHSKLGCSASRVGETIGVAPAPGIAAIRRSRTPSACELPSSTRAARAPCVVLQETGGDYPSLLGAAAGEHSFGRGRPRAGRRPSTDGGGQPRREVAHVRAPDVHAGAAGGSRRCWRRVNKPDGFDAFVVSRTRTRSLARRATRPRTRCTLTHAQAGSERGGCRLAACLQKLLCRSRVLVVVIVNGGFAGRFREG
jgi:hypothetical protein